MEDRIDVVVVLAAFSDFATPDPSGCTAQMCQGPLRSLQKTIDASRSAASLRGATAGPTTRMPKQEKRISVRICQSPGIE